MTESVLIGRNRIGRQDLRDIPTPAGTTTFHPVSHAQLIEALIETLGFRHLEVVKDEYVISDDGLRMFGLLELQMEQSGIRFAIGCRNGNDKTMRLGLTAGYRVMICENMSMYGDFSPIMRKHSKGINLVELVSIGVDAIQRNFEPLIQRIEMWKGFELSDQKAKVILADAFIGRQLDVPKHLGENVYHGYFEPEIEEFKPRTMFSLENAFTGAFKKLHPISQFQATAALPKFLAAYN